jgi:folate-dependent phosphoribosylglycinamide formyltransferase PurN
MINNFLKDSKKTLRGAIFISGNGTNAEKILENKTNTNNWTPAVIITDRPETSRALEIGSKFNIPVIPLDIKQFYNERGEKRISILTERGREIREEWTDTLRQKLKKYEVDFGILAGFVLMSNITNDFPCLNIHPGDLTVEEDNKRILVGLHTIPIEAAILKGLDSMRSSVIIAQKYIAAGDGMDSGPILGISTPVPINFFGHTTESLIECHSQRPHKRPLGGYGDTLEDIAKKNQESLKVEGDWVVFPQVIEDFTAGKFGYGQNGELYYKSKDEWQSIKTVVYGKKSKELITQP